MRYLYQLAICICLLMVTACQHAPKPGYTELPNVVRKREELKNKLLSLVPEEKKAAAQEEATWLADTSYKAAAAIARYNDPVFVNWLNNRLINTRKSVRQRGLCWHYQHDLYRELRRRPLKYYDLGCCVKDRGKGGEHHVVYVRAKAGKWPAIVMLDAWWNAGRLRVEDERDAEDWEDDPKSTAELNSIYPAGHKKPMEHWYKIRYGTKYASYIESDEPAARNTEQWKYMQEHIKKGLEQRKGKPYAY